MRKDAVISFNASGNHINVRSLTIATDRIVRPIIMFGVTHPVVLEV